MKIRFSLPVIMAIILTFILLPGSAFAWPWSWDMFTQPSHKAQEEKAVVFPQDTVTTKGKIVPFPFKTREEAAAILKNPIPPTDESLARGKVLYGIYCALCHGDTGRGDGKVGKKYMSPADLTSEHVQKLSEGSVYFTITYGGVGKDEQMPGYADALTPEDRWHITNYMRQVISWW
ncbi:MAG: c-type cytochrome [Deltaproteobacteria bacterium]|nr:c-type cytochrome [Deltaproteobacteria bacterium]